MRFRFLQNVAVSITVIVACSLSLSTYVYSQSTLTSTEYFCAAHNGHPATMRRMSEGNIPIIGWTSNRYVGDLTPAQRCQVVSSRFQQAYNDGSLRYIGTGVVNGQSVICATSYKGSNSCIPSRVLLTLNPGTRPDAALANLLDLNRIILGNPLYQNGDLLIYSPEGEAYVNMETLTNAIISVGD